MLDTLLRFATVGRVCEAQVAVAGSREVLLGKLKKYGVIVL